VATAYTGTAKMFKAFCDENRLRILELLRTGEKCACVLLDDLHITQSTLSHHMKILCDSGVVQGRKEGKWVHYSIDSVGAEKAVELLRQQVALDLSCQNAETCCCDNET
jgi:ArsR family transcriptional regulator